ncbi:MAG: assimilatory nitrate reductase catalytic subunit, partial [Nocardioidaceae bacterium]|nr:assimilatory nitrate reductase catalytic subunit [Nocardioidaceae bacterium]
SAPNANRVLDRMRALDCLVVSDIFLSETAAMADVVLPTAQWAEEEGTLTNVEGRVILRRRALPPPDGVRTDLEMLADLADRLGRGKYFSAEPREVFEELRRASAGGLADYAGISYERIEHEKGVFWPCPADAPDGSPHPGTPRLFTERFATPDGRARFLAVRFRGATEKPDDDYPYYLTTGRLMQHYQSGTQTRRTKSLLLTVPDAIAELHPDLARRHGISASDLVELRTRRGRAVFRARLVDTIRPDTVFAPFHWGGASLANVLTSPALDPQSRMPEFKTCALAIARNGGPDDPLTVRDDSALPPATSLPISTANPASSATATERT